MNIECLHMGGACSTLLLSGFNNYNYENFDEFAKLLKKRMTAKSVINSYTGIHTGTDYSFVFASTNGAVGMQERVKEYFKRLGFYVTEPSPNKKNRTTVQLHVISVHQLMDKLKEIVK